MLLHYSITTRGSESEWKEEWTSIRNGNNPVVERWDWMLSQHLEREEKQLKDGKQRVMPSLVAFLMTGWDWRQTWFEGIERRDGHRLETERVLNMVYNSEGTFSVFFIPPIFSIILIFLPFHVLLQNHTRRMYLIMKLMHLFLNFSSLLLP